MKVNERKWVCDHYSKLKNRKMLAFPPGNEGQLAVQHEIGPQRGHSRQIN
jgi:hypothetical protein